MSSLSNNIQTRVSFFGSINKSNLQETTILQYRHVRNKILSSPWYRPSQILIQASPNSQITQRIHLCITNEMAAKLRPQTPSNHHRLVLFCTRSNTIYLGNCVVEFPAQLEIRSNGTLLPTNSRGMKNKKRTINPPDITAQCILLANVNNNIDVTFFESKEVCLVIMLTIAVYFDNLSRRETYNRTNTGENSKERFHL
jgi:hypothetical protein